MQFLCTYTFFGVMYTSRFWQNLRVSRACIFFVWERARINNYFYLGCELRYGCLVERKSVWWAILNNCIAVRGPWAFRGGWDWSEKVAEWFESEIRSQNSEPMQQLEFVGLCVEDCCIDCIGCLRKITSRDNLEKIYW